MQVHWHIGLTRVLGAMQKIPVADEDPTVKVCLVKALAQLIDIYIHCESSANVKRAESALMKGEADFRHALLLWLPCLAHSCRVLAPCMNRKPQNCWTRIASLLYSVWEQLS